MFKNVWKYALILSLGLALTACNDDNNLLTLEELEAQVVAYLTENNLDAEQTSAGNYYLLLSQGPRSRSPQVGEKVSLELSGFNLDGSPIPDADGELDFAFGANSLNPQLEDIISEVFENDQIRAFLYLPDGAIYYDVLVASIQNEVEQIEEYASNEALSLEISDNGLRYFIENEGTGASPQMNDQVNLNYILKDLDGNILDQSAEQGANLNLSQGQVIDGFIESVLLLKEGGNGIFILPSAIAYGEQGSRGIPPYEPLLFEITLNEVL